MSQAKMETEFESSTSVLLVTQTWAMGLCKRLDSYGPVGALLSGVVHGLLALTTGSAVTSGLRLLSVVVLSLGAFVVIPDFLRYVLSGSAVTRSSTGLVTSTESDGSELLGWLIPLVLVTFITVAAILVTWVGSGGSAWSAPRLNYGKKMRIAPGPKGLPVIGCAQVMHGNAHRKLAKLAWDLDAQKLIAFSVGCTRIVVTSDPVVAREMLVSSVFAERPLKEAAEKLLFDRAMGFAAPGPYWRGLRRIAATSLFCPKQIVAHKEVREQETNRMLQAINEAASGDATESNPIRVRSFLQRASVNNMMRIVFGRRYEFGDSCVEAEELEGMIRGCFDILGAFNWADHFPGMRYLDILHVGSTCKTLVPKVKAFVQRIIDQHRACAGQRLDSEKDFVDVLLALEGEDKMSDEDMISVLWEMIFRGTDTVAVLVEWALAEMVLHPELQKRVQEELNTVVGAERAVEDADMEKLPFLQSVLKETLRVHPPGPLLSWARLATEDVKLGGYDVPKGTTAMVNMWAITHDEAIWKNPFEFNPQRFMELEADFDVRGGDLRLAPFGAGRRVCPGRSLGLATSHLWLARLLHQFSWSQAPGAPVDLTEDLKLSCEMACPLQAVPTLRTKAMF
ncbi:unnamed protein product [Calypogeia fissa]